MQASTVRCCATWPAQITRRDRCMAPPSRRDLTACAAASAERCLAAKFTSPKTGAVGEERFKKGAVPGTYWSDDLASTSGTSGSGAGSFVCVEFDTGSEIIRVEAPVGGNLLRAAEQCGAMVPNDDFCFEGSCSHCEMDVQGGASEVGYRAYESAGGLVRSCLCPVPAREEGVVKVQLLSEDGAWGEGVI